MATHHEIESHENYLHLLQHGLFGFELDEIDAEEIRTTEDYLHLLRDGLFGFKIEEENVKGKHLIDKEREKEEDDDDDDDDLFPIEAEDVVISYDYYHDKTTKGPRKYDPSYLVLHVNSSKVSEEVKRVFTMTPSTTVREKKLIKETFDIWKSWGYSVPLWTESKTVKDVCLQKELMRRQFKTLLEDANLSEKELDTLSYKVFVKVFGSANMYSAWELEFCRLKEKSNFDESAVLDVGYVGKQKLKRRAGGQKISPPLHEELRSRLSTKEEQEDGKCKVCFGNDINTCINPW
jgi:hypothetical protein